MEDKTYPSKISAYDAGQLNGGIKKSSSPYLCCTGSCDQMMVHPEKIFVEVGSSSPQQDNFRLTREVK
jgi:hypothetical protein